jgi:phenylacetate-CoA ligase
MQNLPYLTLRQIWWALTDYPARSVTQFLADSQWWSRQKLEAYQDLKLQQLIQHCYENVPYYQQLMDERSLRPRDFQSVVDLHKLPILTKSDLRKNWHKLRAKNIPDKDVSINVTGGSTGEPLKIAKQISASCWETMATERGFSWAGLMPGMRRIILMGGTLGGFKDSWQTPLKNMLSGIITLPAYDLGEHNIDEYADAVRKSRAHFLIGYPSSVYDLARRLLERGNTLPLRGVLTSAERLYPEWSEVVREAMKCEVYQYYGCAECNSMAYQCQEGESYHITEEHVILEVRTESGSICSSGSGEVVLTNLDNQAMPLLRYLNGDYVTIDDDLCSCGRSLKLISQLEGRSRDFLFRSNGDRVSGGISTYVMRHVDAVSEFQVRQESLTRIRVLVVPAKELCSTDRTYIRDAFRHYLGDGIDIAIDEVQAIARTKARKRQIVVNEMLNA